MIAISEEGKQAFYNRDNIRIELRFENGLTLNNSDFVSGSFQIEQTLCEEEQLVYGSIGSACLSVQILKTLQTYKGLKFSAYAIAGDNYEVSLGTYTVVEDELSDNRRIRSLKAYDEIYTNYNTDVSSWYEQLNFPMTLFEFRNSLFNHIGITQENVSLINDGMLVNRTVDTADTTLTFKDVLSAICEINGALGCITQGNNFRYVTPDIFNDALYPNDDLYPSNDLYPKDFFHAGLFPNNNLFPSNNLYPSDPTVVSTIYATSNTGIVKQGSYVYKDYIVKPIEKVVIKETEQDYGTIYGDGTNTYEVIGNFLCYASDELPDIAHRLYNIISRVSYQPTKLTILGSPWVELGDYVKVIGTQGASVFPLLHRTINGITSMTDSFEAKGIEYCETQLDGTNGSIRQLKSRTLKIVQSIKEVSTELEQYEEETDGTLIRYDSRISQTVHTIELKVTGGTLDSESSARITLTAKDENGNVISSGGGTITLSGTVIFESNLTDGTTEISGDNIKTGTIVLGGNASDTPSIEVKNSRGQTIILIDENGLTFDNGMTISYDDISGTPTIPSKTSQLTNDSDYVNSSQVPSKTSQLTNDSDYVNSSQVPSRTSDLIDDIGWVTAEQTTQITRNTVTTAYVNALNVTARYIVADLIQAGCTKIGKMTITQTYIAGINDDNTRRVALRAFDNNYGDDTAALQVEIRGSTSEGWTNRMFIRYNGDTWIGGGADLWVEDINKATGNQVTVNAELICWGNVITYGDFLDWSDRRVKKDIQPLSEKYLKAFYALSPTEFRMDENIFVKDDGKLHLGFIAQDVEKAFNDSDIDVNQYALLQENDIELNHRDRQPGEEKPEKETVKRLSLSYNEFTALITLAVQEQKKEIDLLREEIDELKEEIKLLKGE